MELIAPPSSVSRCCLSVKSADEFFGLGIANGQTRMMMTGTWTYDDETAIDYGWLFCPSNPTPAKRAYDEIAMLTPIFSSLGDFDYGDAANGSEIDFYKDYKVYADICVLVNCVDI